VTDPSSGVGWRERPVVRRHLLFGWWALLVFLCLGIGLEAMHGFKIGWYLDVSNQTRRLMFTLAHSHGALLSILNIAFAFTLWIVDARDESWTRLASACLIGATVCLPGGFWLGGFFIWGGDPGLGVLLAPVGGFLLLAAVFFAARGIQRAD
jgi:hypothetical protein